jgi:hypothetical protein
MLLRALLLGLVFAPDVRPQSLSPELPPGVLLLSRVKARVKRQFVHMPEFTCLETLDRFHKPGGRKAVEKQLDTVRLEVLFAGKEEFFDSPGGRNFRESDPSKFIAAGMIGNGMFASHLKSIFVDDNGIFKYRGEEDLNGRRAARFDFHVPSLQDDYVISVPGAQASVGVAGTFWADPVTYDLIRLTIDADEIPPILQTSQIVTTVDYAPTRIGVDDALLAQTGTMLLVRNSGETAFDRFEFTHCRAYQAESTLSFDDPVPVPAGGVRDAVPRPPAQVIPAGLSVTIALTVPLTDRMMAGELVEGKVAGNVVARGGVVIPNGSLVHGRVRRLERFSESGGYFSIGLEFTDIDAGGTPLRFFADLQNVDEIPALERTLVSDHTQLGPMSQLRTIDRITMPELPGVGSFFMRGAHFEIPAGFRMIWKTRAM